MDITDVFVGLHVTHVREAIRGDVIRVIEQPEPFPPHVEIRLEGSTIVQAWPINQLIAAPSVPPPPADAPPADAP